MLRAELHFVNAISDASNAADQWKFDVAYFPKFGVWIKTHVLLAVVKNQVYFFFCQTFMFKKRMSKKDIHKYSFFVLLRIKHFRKLLNYRVFHLMFKILTSKWKGPVYVTRFQKHEVFFKLWETCNMIPDKMKPKPISLNVSLFSETDWVYESAVCEFFNDEGQAQVHLHIKISRRWQHYFYRIYSILTLCALSKLRFDFQRCKFNCFC